MVRKIYLNKTNNQVKTKRRVGIITMYTLKVIKRLFIILTIKDFIQIRADSAKTAMLDDDDRPFQL